MAEGIGLLNQRIVFYTMGSNPISSAMFFCTPKVMSQNGNALRVTKELFEAARRRGFLPWEARNALHSFLEECEAFLASDDFVRSKCEAFLAPHRRSEFLWKKRSSILKSAFGEEAPALSNLKKR